MTAPSSSQAGFTLVESLAAMAVLAVAAGGLIGVTESHIDAVAGLRARIVAQWAAENRLAELQLGVVGAPRQAVSMMGQDLIVDVVSAPTQDPDLLRVTIRARRDGLRQDDAILTGFVDKGTTTP